MHPVKIFSGVHHLFIHFIRKMFADKFLVTGKPVLKNIFHEFYKQAVALYMGLLAQKVDKLVVTVRKLIHFGGDDPAIHLRRRFR